LEELRKRAEDEEKNKILAENLEMRGR